MRTNGRTVRFLPLLLAAMLLAPSAGCSLVRRAAPVADTSQDGRIQQEVRARLDREPSLDAALLRVEVNARTVLLHGSVRGIAAWKCALRNAELVPGVSGVVDYLVLERGPRDAPCLAPAAAPRDREPGRDYIEARDRR